MTPTAADRLQAWLGDLITIPQGSYDKRATKILNQWFSGSGCANRTYIFEKGNYYFDVDDPTLPESDPRRHSLVFADRSSNWIFGTPTYTGYPGSRPNVEDFPNVCDRSTPTVDTSGGVSITLSPRTGLHHTGGRVAICGPVVQGGTQSTAIYQRPSTSLGGRLLPTSLSGSSLGGVVADIQDTDSAALKQTFVIPYQCWDGGECSATSSFTAGFAAEGVNGTDPGPRDGVVAGGRPGRQRRQPGRQPSQNIAKTRTRRG